MPERDDGFDEQDQSEIFDEDNTNLFDRLAESEDAEQAEDLVDVFDATSAVGDDDDDEAVIGEDLDDDEIVELARDNDDDDDDLEDDDLARRDAVAFHYEDGEDDVTDPDNDARERIDGQSSDEAPLIYVGDADRRAHARSAAQPMESKRLSDEDLRQLHYQDEDPMTAKTPDDGRSATPRGRKPAPPKSGKRPDDDLAAERSFDPADKDRHARQDELLDEGVEETFPASDPVSVKRIT